MYTGELANSSTNISSALSKITTATGACERLFELMDMKPSIKSKAGQKLENYKVHIEFKNVDFSYPTTPDVRTLKNFNLSIKVLIFNNFIARGLNRLCWLFWIW